MTDYWNCEILVLGCGNVLFGDDGFGPAVIEHFQQNYEIPPDTSVLNAGLSVREILFNIVLGKQRPKRIVIVDALDAGRSPGEVFELEVSELPEVKIDDFSMHQLPTSNLLRELNEMCGVDVRIISAQVQNIPEEVSLGLSKVLKDSIPAVCEKIVSALNNSSGH
jgi:coenzyme F420 hydrogenase subunit delta